MRSLHAVIDFQAGQDDLRPLQLAFGEPREELVAWTGAEVRAVLAEADSLARRGAWCVGYVRYEAACAFEPGVALHPPDGPLAYFSVHERPAAPPDFAREPSSPLNWQRQTGRDQFESSMVRIHDAIARGEVYQVNYTGALQAAYGGDPFELFCALRRAQPKSNAAFFSHREEAVLSVSPELFFDWDGDRLQCRPMKGTAPRGTSPALDARHAEHLRSSAKERSENVMIVDLIRNDMSRVAQLGSVQVPQLFHCEPWPTVWQMTSTVKARTQLGIRLQDIFQALFPCGSVTGAPKLRAMHWIKELEPGPRGVYCGAAGVVLPGGSARFNVPIRTVTVRHGLATCGIGSGITADATAESEWAEWGCKTGFLEQASRPFRLLQTIRIEGGRPFHVGLHLDRLAAAGAHFGVPVNRQGIHRALAAAVSAHGTGQGRARVTVDVRGAATVDISDLPRTPADPQPVALARHAVTAPPAFLRHKTTRRDHLTSFPADTASAFDTLLWNNRGEITEFTRGNVILERHSGELVTPPLHCGVLDGVGRSCELSAGHIQEAVVRVDELDSIRRLWFVNALRGRVPVELYV